MRDWQEAKEAEAGAGVGEQATGGGHTPCSLCNSLERLHTR